MTGDRGGRRLHVLYAGSLARLVREDIIPVFEGKMGCPVSATAGGSRELAQAVREGRVAADVLLSADSEVIEAELAGWPEGPEVSWYFTFATNAMVLAFGRQLRRGTSVPSEFAAEDAARVLRQGLRLGRSDPEGDPQGYRAVIVVQLLERVLGERGLLEAGLGEPRNSGQIVPSDQIIPRLRSGDLDLAFLYRSHAVEEQLPFADLPETVNLASARLAEEYAKAAYRCADGTVYRGRPITYAAAPVGDKCPSSAAMAFLAFLGSGEVGEALRKHGFGHVCRLDVPAAGRRRGGDRHR